jgi:hypothetical protein
LIILNVDMFGGALTGAAGPVLVAATDDKAARQ